MQDFYIEATHSCGHSQHHSGSTTGGAAGVRSLRDFYSKRKCDTCRPQCEYCRRVGDRENMLIVEVNCYSTEAEVAAAKAGRVFCNDWCFDQAQRPTHYREHNGIAIPGFLQGWNDYSYHNDTCGRSEYSIGPHAVCMWVEHEALTDRDDPTCSKYVVEFCPNGENRGADGDVLYQGDDTTVAAQWAQAVESVDGVDADDDAAIAPMVARIRELIANPEVK